MSKMEESTTVIYTRTPKETNMNTSEDEVHDEDDEEKVLKCILFDQDSFYDVRMLAADKRQTDWSSEYLPELERSPKDAYTKSLKGEVHSKNQFFEKGNIGKLSRLDSEILSRIHVENVVVLGSTQDGLYLEQGFPIFDKGVTAVNESDVDVVFEYGGIDILQNCKISDGLHLCLTNTKYPGYFKFKICTPQMKANLHFFKNTHLKLKLFGDLDSSRFYVVVNSLNEALNSASIAGNTEDELGIHEMDNVAAFKMKEWPKVASGFISRERQSGWPSEELIRSATAHGCGFVPKGVSNSKEKDYHWRISFAASEKVLARSLSLPQIRSYLILKSLFKLKLAEPEGLTSYMMKNILFWTIEAIDQSSWSDDNILFCVEALVDMLCACLDKGMILSFFLPSVNLLGNLDAVTLAHLRSKAEWIQRDTFTAVTTCTGLQDFKGSCFVSMPILLSSFAAEKEDIDSVCSMAYFTIYLHLRLQVLRYRIRLSPWTLQKSFANNCRSMLSAVAPRAVWYLLESIRLQPDTSLYNFHANGDKRYDLQIRGMRSKILDFWRSPVFKGLFSEVVKDQEYIQKDTVNVIPEFREFIDWVDCSCLWKGGVAINIDNVQFPIKLD